MALVDVLPPADSSQAIATLYREHSSWLRGWLRGKLNCSETAADLAQDTFVRLLRRELEDGAIREPRSYLSAIARGLLFNHWRHQAVERAYLELMTGQDEPTSLCLEQQQLLVETLVRLAQVLEGMPVRDKQIFLLARLDGLKYQEIAQQLGVSINVVQKAMVRGMERCYRVLYE